MGAIHEINEDVAIRLSTRAVVTIAARDVVEQCIAGSLAASASSMPLRRTFPRVGDYWKGQGGINAGIMLTEDGKDEYMLIVPPRTSHPHPKLTWDKAKAYAAEFEIEGHRDFSLMTRREGRLAEVNAKSCFIPDENYWLAEQYAGNASLAWAQVSSYGNQGSWHKSNECSVLAVRRYFFSDSILR